MLAAPLLLSFSLMNSSSSLKERRLETEQAVYINTEPSAEESLIYLEYDYQSGSIEKQMYRNILTRKHVIEFYSEIAGSYEFAEMILKYSDRHDLRYSLVFALVWVESRFNYKAVNFNSNSIDRGLFQLNSSSFPELEEKDFFNPEKNIAIGTRYLKWCLENGDNEIVALAMYNAGRTKVERDNTPRMTLDYISRVLSFQEEVDRRFNKQIAEIFDSGRLALLIN